MLHDMTPGDGILDQILALILPPPSKPAPPPASAQSTKVTMVQGFTAMSKTFAADPQVLALVLQDACDLGTLVACRTVAVVGQVLSFLPGSYSTRLQGFSGGYRTVLVPKDKPQQVLARLSQKLK